MKEKIVSYFKDIIDVFGSEKGAQAGGAAESSRQRQVEGEGERKREVEGRELEADCPPSREPNMGLHAQHSTNKNIPDSNIT